MALLGTPDRRPAASEHRGSAEGGLFSECALGELRLKNRVIMAPLSRARADIDSREPTPRMELYYAQRASAGMIVSEATHVSPFSVSRPGGAAIHTDTQERQWARVTRAVHAEAGLIVQQLYHVGRKAACADMPGECPPIAPSAVRATGDVTTRVGKRPFGMPRVLQGHEIGQIVGEFRRAAERSRAAGFDGVEIHAANGYLIEQFLRPASNQREDGYGGSVSGRARFLLEVVDAVATVFRPSRVGVRLSPHHREDDHAHEDTCAVAEYVAHELGRRGVAYMHLVEPEDTPSAQRVAPILRRNFGGGLVVCDGYTRDSAMRCLRDGSADCVAFGRLYIANADLVDRFRIGAALNVAREELFRKGGDAGYTDYPTLESRP